MRGKEMKKMDKGTNAKELRNIGISLIIHDRRYQGFIFLNSSHPRQAETKCVKGKEGQCKWEGEGEKKERKKSNRLNLTIFLVCAFLVALSIYAGVLTKQTV